MPWIIQCTCFEPSRPPIRKAARAVRSPKEQKIVRATRNEKKRVVACLHVVYRWLGLADAHVLSKMRLVKLQITNRNLWERYRAPSYMQYIYMSLSPMNRLASFLRLLRSRDWRKESHFRKWNFRLWLVQKWVGGTNDPSYANIVDGKYSITWLMQWGYYPSQFTTVNPLGQSIAITSLIGVLFNIRALLFMMNRNCWHTDKPSISRLINRPDLNRENFGYFAPPYKHIYNCE